MLWILSLQNVPRCSLALDETVASSRLKKDWSAFPVIKWQFSFCAHPDKKADRVSQGPKVGLRRTPEWLEKKGLCPWQISLFDFRSLLLFSSGIEPSKKVRVIALISLSFHRSRLEARILEDKVFCHFRVTQFFSGQSSFILCILSLSHSEIILFSVKHFSEKKRFKVERQPLRQFLHLACFAEISSGRELFKNYFGLWTHFW